MEPKTARHEFASTALNAEGLAQVEQIRQIFSNALTEIERRCPAGRELALAKTHLQDAAHWAIRGVASKPEVAA